MGTNYYLELKDNVEICPHCGQNYNPKLHIGKSSAGWCFSLHVIPEKGLDSLEDWEEKFKEGKIFDEYGKEIGWGEMSGIIRDRYWGEGKDRKEKPYGCDSWDEFHRQNHSRFGPKGLIRSLVDGRHCIGNGEGTWDLIAGEFS